MKTLLILAALLAAPAYAIALDTFLVTDDTVHQTSASTQLVSEPRWTWAEENERVKSSYLTNSTPGYRVSQQSYAYYPAGVQAAPGGYDVQMIREGYYWDQNRGMWVMSGVAKHYVTPPRTLPAAQRSAYRRAGLFGRGTARSCAGGT